MGRGAWLDFLGIEQERPITALREAMECVRHLLERSPEPYRGKVFTLAGGDSLRWHILRSGIPFMLGAWGSQAIGACAGLITEIKIGGTANPAVIAYMRDAVSRAAVQAGRPSDAIGIAVDAVTLVDQQGDAARALARRKAALYLPVIAKLDHTLGIEPDLLARINAAAASYDFEGAASDISDDLLRRLAFAGTPDEVAAQADALVAAGATRIEFGTPHGLSEESGIRLLGERVLPALRGKQHEPA